MSESDERSNVAVLSPRAGKPMTQPDASIEQLRRVIHDELQGVDVEPFSQEDQRVVDDESAFIARFGFDWPRRFRRDLIHFKHRVDVTDKEIRLLQKTRNFLLHPDRGLELCAKRWMWVWGWTQVYVLGIVLGLPLLHVIKHAFLSTFQYVAWLIILVVWLSLSRAVFLFYVRPWQIQQRVTTERPEYG